MPSPVTAPGRPSSGLVMLMGTVSPTASFRLGAVLAEPEDAQVAVVGPEPELADQRPEGILDPVPPDARDLVAPAADGVGVLVAGCRVVGRRPVGEVRVPDQAELVEELEGSVDGGEVDR